MTALRGEGRPTIGVHNSMNPVAERPEGSTATRARPLEQIFPLRGDANRGREMQATWRSFCRDRTSAVKAALAAGRSPPEIAYQLGELLHNHFRTRGVTLTSYELRRLVAELIALDGPPPEQKDKPADKVVAAPTAPGAAVVAFGGEPPKGAWADDAAPKSAPSLPTRPLPAAQPPVPVAALREPASFAQLLTRVLERLRGRPGSRDRQAARAAIDEAVNSVAREQDGEVSASTRDRLVRSALSEIVGLGLIDRLWADRAVRTILVNGPSSVLVDRDGTLQPVPERFRDQAHLLELIERLVGRPASGIADLHLRDGSNGVVIFPPVAPAGPVLILRRVRPGEATLDELVGGGVLARQIAELLRLGARSRLNMLVTGPSGSGKTALLAAVARDLGIDSRVVTVAGHRQFRWSAASNIELVASPAAPYSALIAAGAKLEPVLLVLDSVQLEDVAALSGHLLRGKPGMLASLKPDAMSASLARSANLVVHLDHGADGRFGAIMVEDSAGDLVFRYERGTLVRGTPAPAFAATIQARGHGDALMQLLG